MSSGVVAKAPEQKPKPFTKEEIERIAAEAREWKRALEPVIAPIDSVTPTDLRFRVR